jgi:hypothetical protein
MYKIYIDRCLSKANGPSYYTAFISWRGLICASPVPTSSKFRLLRYQIPFLVIPAMQPSSAQPDREFEQHLQNLGLILNDEGSVRW